MNASVQCPMCGRPAEWVGCAGCGDDMGSVVCRSCGATIPGIQLSELVRCSTETLPTQVDRCERVG
ncbi:MAG: hypothetical protein ABIK09_10135 [Pseudomonadota bacterium]